MRKIHSGGAHRNGPRGIFLCLSKPFLDLVFLVQARGEIPRISLQPSGGQRIPGDPGGHLGPDLRPVFARLAGGIDRVRSKT